MGCSLPFECLPPSPECWCKTIKIVEPLRQRAMTRYADYFCTTCLSLMFFSSNQLPTMWGMDLREHL